MRTICPHCQQQYDIEHIYNGATANCEMCNQDFVIAPDILPQNNSLLQNLNQAQIQAVTQTFGYVRVIAGPGTGKTRVLTQRLAYLIKTLQVPPDEILSVTFTNKAAKEMKQRVRKLLGDNISTRVQTFHGFCNTVLREDISHIRFPQSFVIMDIEDQKLLVKECLETYGLNLKDFSFKEIKKAIAAYKNRKDYVSLIATNDNIQALAATEAPPMNIVLSYVAFQKQRYMLDYDDLLNYTLYIFEKYPEVLAKWQQRLSYVQVDEFQDVNGVQYTLSTLLSEQYKNLFVVGDPDQTIYEWRGADINYFLDFPADFTIKLQQNYRSTPQIIDSCNKLIKHNQLRIENEIAATKEAGSAVQSFIADFYGKQAKWVANNIRKLSAKYSYSDIAILCRALYVTRSLEECLVKNKIPYHIYNGIDFYRRREIKDALSYLRLASQNDDLAFCRIINTPARGIGKKRLQRLKELAANCNRPLFDTLQNNLHDSQFAECHNFVKTILEIRKRAKEGKKLSVILDYALDASGYTEMIRNDSDQDRLKNLQELALAILELEKEEERIIPPEEYLSNISLYSERDEEQGVDCVKIMTIHNAKGLEFPCVFVVSLNEGILPSFHAYAPKDVEQERRVAYVAFSRAQDKLFLSSDFSPFLFSQENLSQEAPSRFLLESGMDITNATELTTPQPRPLEPPQKSKLKILKQAPRPRATSTMTDVKKEGLKHKKEKTKKPPKRKKEKEPVKRMKSTDTNE